MQFIIFVLLAIARYWTTPKITLFFDEPEYLRIVASHSFFQVFSLGHFPIHPLFMGFLWIATRIAWPNGIAFILGIISVFIFYKISKIIFKKNHLWLVTLLFSLFPVVWMTGTNLLIESLLIPLYLLAIYSFIRRKYGLFSISIFLMLGTQVEAIFWIPTIFIFPIIFKDEIRFYKEDTLRIVKFTLAALLFSFLFYSLIYLFIRKDFGGSGEQLSTYLTLGALRAVRNVWLSFIRSFGTFTPFVLGYLLLRNVKSKLEISAWIIFLVSVSALGAYWGGDLMIRRIVFAGVILALVLYKYLKDKTIFLILYLLPIITANGILYLRNNPNFQLSLMQKYENQLPSGQVLVQTQYLQPFTKYDGIILWLESGDLSQIDNYLKSGKRVFLDRFAVTSPYLLLVGNNYHITSFGKVGDSESKVLFQKYRVSISNNSYELKLNDNSKVSSDAGEPIVFYNQNFWGRLDRERLDYGDIGTWIYAIITDHHDSTGWTYKDIKGNWVYLSAN